MSCKEAKRLEGFAWDLVGDAEDGRASRCPKCKSPFEKISGCQHMKCAVCHYEWCWVCGMPFHSIVHYGQFGGIVCELISKVSLGKRSCLCRVLLYILLFVAIPFIVLFLSLFTAGLISFLIYDSLIGKSLKSWSIASCKTLDRLKSGMCKFLAKAVNVILLSIVYITVFIVFFATGAVIFALIFTVMIIPSILLYIFVLVKQACHWKSNRKHS